MNYYAYGLTPILLLLLAALPGIAQQPYEPKVVTDIYGHVGIGTTEPDGSALLDVNGTDAGFLVPRMSTLNKNAITAPATSLLVFDTDGMQFEYYDGTKWIPFITGNNNTGWKLNGNDITGPEILGTTNAFDLNLVAGGPVRMTIDNATGNVGIGTTNPGYTLEVDGDVRGNNNAAFGEKELTGHLWNGIAIPLDVSFAFSKTINSPANYSSGTIHDINITGVLNQKIIDGIQSYIESNSDDDYMNQQGSTVNAVSGWAFHKNTTGSIEDINGGIFYGANNSLTGNVQIAAGAIGFGGNQTSGGPTERAFGIIGGIVNYRSTLGGGAALRAIAEVNLQGSVTDSLFGVAVENWISYGNGTVNHSFGIFIDPTIDMGTTNSYAIYSQSASDSYLNGNLGIGTDTPARSLHVDQYMRLEPTPDPPPAPSAGDIYFDSDDNKLKCYDGAVWQDLF